MANDEVFLERYDRRRPFPLAYTAIKLKDQKFQDVVSKLEKAVRALPLKQDKDGNVMFTEESFNLTLLEKLWEALLPFWRWLQENILRVDVSNMPRPVSEIKKEASEQFDSFTKYIEQNRPASNREISIQF